ncbi:MAG: cupin domain-containing protein [Candidatus Omnitrophota bacterium]
MKPIMKSRPQYIIENLALKPHPEGGYFKEVYRAEKILTVDGKQRNAVTQIYFLLLGGQVSKIHRILFDEIWHFYEGTPLLLLDINSDFSGYEEILLGRQERGTIKYNHCIKGGRWQSAESLGEYTLVGCTVSPGFDFQDFEMPDNKLSKDISSKQPQLIKYLVTFQLTAENNPQAASSRGAQRRRDLYKNRITG